MNPYLTPEQREVLEDVLKVIQKPNIVVKKGSYLRIQFGTDAIYMVTQLPPVVTTTSIVQVLGPRGVALCNAVDLRPCEEVRLEDEE